MIMRCTFHTYHVSFGPSSYLLLATTYPYTGLFVRLFVHALTHSSLILYIYSILLCLQLSIYCMVAAAAAAAAAAV